MSLPQTHRPEAGGEYYGSQSQPISSRTGVLGGQHTPDTGSGQGDIARLAAELARHLIVQNQLQPVETRPPPQPPRHWQEEEILLSARMQSNQGSDTEHRL